MKVPVHIRWMIKRDMPEVLAIENGAFEFPWTEDEFIRCLRMKNCIGMVAENDERVVGFMIYGLFTTRLELWGIAVSADYQGRGVGRQMVQTLIGKLSDKRRISISAEVRETNLAAQKFFAATGFKAVEVLHDYYEDKDEDAYVMQFMHKSEAMA